MKNNLISFIVACSVAFSVNATVYKWTDSNGEIQYSENPPLNVDSTPLSIQSAPSSSANEEIKRYEKINKQFSAMSEKEQAEKAKAEKAAEEAHLKKINCERAKTHLQSMESQPRIRLENAQGNVTALTTEERDADIKRTKEDIEKYCTP